MSRNFEVLQRLERERTATYGAAAPALLAEEEQRLADVAVVLPRLTSAPQPSDRAEKFVRDEEIKLVHELFFKAGSARNRIVVFAGAEPGVGCSEMCRHAAEILAARVSGNVCLLTVNSEGARNHKTQRVTGGHVTQAWCKSAQRLTPNLWRMALDTAALTPSSEQLLSLREQFDYVLIDSSAVQPHGETTATAQSADAVVLVVKAGQTRREVVRRALEALRAVNAQIAGVVLNQRTFPIPQALYERL